MCRANYVWFVQSANRPLQCKRPQPLWRLKGQVEPGIMCIRPTPHLPMCIAPLRCFVMASPPPRQPQWLRPLMGQLELGMTCLSTMLAVVRTSPEGLIPLVRMALQSLTVDSMNAFHVKAVGES